MDDKEFKRVICLLGMLGSDSQGEAGNAGRAADKIIRKYGTWEDFLNGRIPIQTVQVQQSVKSTRICGSYKKAVEALHGIQSMPYYLEAVKMVSVLFARLPNYVRSDVLCNRVSQQGAVNGKRRRASYLNAVSYLKEHADYQNELIGIVGVIFGKSINTVGKDVYQ